MKLPFCGAAGEVTAYDSSKSYLHVQQMPIPVPGAPLPYAHGKAAEDGLTAWAPARIVRDAEMVWGSWMWPVMTLRLNKSLVVN